MSDYTTKPPNPPGIPYSHDEWKAMKRYNAEDRNGAWLHDALVEMVDALWTYRERTKTLSGLKNGTAWGAPKVEADTIAAELGIE